MARQIRKFLPSVAKGCFSCSCILIWIEKGSVIISLHVNIQDVKQISFSPFEFTKSPPKN